MLRSGAQVIDRSEGRRDTLQLPDERSGGLLHVSLEPVVKVGYVRDGGRRVRPGFRGDSAFFTWLYRIATNTSLNAIRSRRRRPEDADAELIERIGLVNRVVPDGELDASTYLVDDYGTPEQPVVLRAAAALVVKSV